MENSKSIVEHGVPKPENVSALNEDELLAGWCSCSDRLASFMGKQKKEVEGTSPMEDPKACTADGSVDGNRAGYQPFRRRH